MDALELYKLIEDNSIEWHWRTNEDKDDVLIFCNDYDVLNKLSDTWFCDDGWWNCVLTSWWYIALWMTDFCEYLGIEVEKVFPRNEE